MRFRHTCTPFAYMTILNNYKGLYPRLYRFSTHHPVAIWNGIGIEVPLLSAHTKQWRCRWYGYGMMMINKGTGELFVCFFLSAIASTKPGAFVFYSPLLVGAHIVWCGRRWQRPTVSAMLVCAGLPPACIGLYSALISATYESRACHCCAPSSTEKLF